MNGADSLCDTLLAGDIDVCFANPGTSEMHIVAALDRKPEMRCILGLVENVVTGAADGYARMARKPAATLLHMGPGLTNGLANIHNARRARSPMLNIVGDHASIHLRHDAPLTSDIAALARPMSDWVHSTAVGAVSQDTATAIAITRRRQGGIATLILPADAAWGEAPRHISVPKPPARRRRVAAESIREAAILLRSGKRVAILLGDDALLEAALAAASRISQATGARIVAEQSNRRIERGAGRTQIDRVIYAVDASLADLAELDAVILIGAKAPVAFFAYPNKPSSMLPRACEILELACPGDDFEDAMAALAEEVGVKRGILPVLAELAPPSLARGLLTPDTLANAIGALLPEGAIICDESLTAGFRVYGATANSPRHDYLQLTGGAIGIGLPMATGAAVACPDRKVICLQADGSGMYTAQALWTQARERLDVISIVLANRSYAILYQELKNVGVDRPGANAHRLFDLTEPSIDWVKLAGAMGVEGSRATTAEELVAALQVALRKSGPHLIEAVL